MRAIILASGRGTRMAPLTDTIPKPMLMVGDKNLLEWKLSALPKNITDVLFVVGYMSEKISEYFKDSWNGIRIHYVYQETLNGTGGAMMLCKDFVIDNTLVLMGDDIYDRNDLAELQKYKFSILGQEDSTKAVTKGELIIDSKQNCIGINEGLIQTNEHSHIINAAAYSISPEYYNASPVRVSDSEYGLPQTLMALSGTHNIHCIKTQNWIQITKPDDLASAEKKLEQI